MLKIDYTKIKTHIMLGLGELRRQEIDAMILTVSEGIAVKGSTLKRKNLTTDVLSEACQGDTVIFVRAVCPVFDAKACEQIRLLRNDLESLGFELLDYVLVSATKVAYATEVGLL